MNLKEFLSELKRRKVYRVSIAYGFSAWLLAQIAGLISESFEAEPWVMQVIIVILMGTLLPLANQPPNLNFQSAL